VPGVYFAPGQFNIVGFLDGSIFESNAPGTGPVGDWVDAPRRLDAFEIQYSVFTRWKQLHGLKVLSIIFPNGISIVYGPGSARRHDGYFTALCNLEARLQNIQQNHFNGYLYRVYTDSGFPLGLCIAKAIRPIAHHLDVLGNFKLNSERIGIEWSYGMLSNLMRACRTFDQLTLYRTHPYAYEQLRVSFLLLNCYVCFHGNQMTSMHRYGIRPPSVEEYLHL
jgi:hypothetical protein